MWIRKTANCCTHSTPTVAILNRIVTSKIAQLKLGPDTDKIRFSPISYVCHNFWFITWHWCARRIKFNFWFFSNNTPKLLFVSSLEIWLSWLDKFFFAEKPHFYTNQYFGHCRTFDLGPVRYQRFLAMKNYYSRKVKKLHVLSYHTKFDCNGVKFTLVRYESNAY